MKNMVIIFLILVLTVFQTNCFPQDLSISKTPAGITADSVVQKYIDALGGKENLLKVKDLSMKYLAENSDGYHAMSSFWKEPNKFLGMSIGKIKKRFIIDMFFSGLHIRNDLGQQEFEITSKYDGEKGRFYFSTSILEKNWPFSDSQLEAANIFDGLHSFLYLSRNGIKTDLTGIKIINDKKTYEITFTLPSGQKLMKYFDISSGLLIRDGNNNNCVDYYDYKENQSVMFPYKRVVQSTGTELLEMYLISIEVNTGIADSVFEVK